MCTEHMTFTIFMLSCEFSLSLGYISCVADVSTGTLQWSFLPELLLVVDPCKSLQLLKKGSFFEDGEYGGKLYLSVCVTINV